MGIWLIIKKLITMKQKAHEHSMKLDELNLQTQINGIKKPIQIYYQSFSLTRVKT